MTPIVVAMEVGPNGVLVREAFVCISTLETVESRVDQLETMFKNKAFDNWGEERRKSAEGAISRGNTLVFKPFFY
jgi:hypothetical protein